MAIRAEGGAESGQRGAPNLRSDVSVMRRLYERSGVPAEHATAILREVNGQPAEQRAAFHEAAEAARGLSKK